MQILKPENRLNPVKPTIKLKAKTSKIGERKKKSRVNIIACLGLFETEMNNDNKLIKTFSKRAYYKFLFVLIIIQR